jgi:hypothetical protein
MTGPQISAFAKAVSVAGLSGVVLSSALTLSAQRNAAPSASLPTVRPQVACAAMAGRSVPASAIGLPTGGATITSAKLDPGTGPIAHKANFVPEHCSILGVIKPVDPQGGNIEFGMAIPTEWNQKVWGVGGNQTNGFIPLLAELARGVAGSPVGPTLPPHTPYPIAQGFALWGSDSGHQGAGGPWNQRQAGAPLPPRNAPPLPPGGRFNDADPATWMRNDEQFRNYAYEHIKKTHDAAAQIIQDMYGMKPTHTYWGGESHGGLDSLNVASHYASDFDGIIGVVPIGSYTNRQYAVNMREKIQMAPGAWVPPAKSKAIEMETLRLCDSLDGLADGVILNYIECNRRLDPRLHPKTFEHIRCPNGGDTGSDCLSDAQIATMDAFRAPMPLGFALANGETEVVGLPAGNGLQGLTPRKPEAKTLPFTMLVWRHGNPDKYDMLKHEIAEFKDDWVELSKWMDSPSDWSTMLAGKTKLILETAASDYTTNAVYTMQVYDRAVKRSGQGAIDKSVRFYVTPNANHQNIGFSTTTGTELPRYVDLMGALVNWVEKGVTPPDPLVQTLEELNPPHKVLRSRPLCRYPQYPRYLSGDAEQAASYRCTAPATAVTSSK